MYARMRRNIHPHTVHVTAANVSEVTDACLVFLAMDSSPDKLAIIEALIAANVPFIDTGVGVAAGLRLGLSEDRAGLLVVRSRGIDVAMTATVAAAVVFTAWTIDPLGTS